jgi:hypothetical protein
LRATTFKRDGFEYNVAMRGNPKSLLLAGAIIATSYCMGISTVGGSAHPYTNAELGFSYTPPSGLRDLTDAMNQADASHLQARIHFAYPLRMFSGPDDKASDWAALGIATLPRGRDKDKGDDVTAGYFTNYALVGGIATKRAVVKIAGHDFSMTRSERNVAPVTRYAIIYTTVHKEQFVSFYFVGNDLSKVQTMAESMNSVRFRL